MRSTNSDRRIILAEDHIVRKQINQFLGGYNQEDVLRKPLCEIPLCNGASPISEMELQKCLKRKYL